jgi:dTDP-4-amino-4,6-dideoxygalactose transaminase
VRATIGLVQLERLAAENEARKQVVARYRSRLADTGLVLPFAAHTEDVQPSFHLAVVVFPSPERRDAARQLLAEQRIQTSLHYPPIHRFSAYSPEPLRVPLPVTEDVTSRLLTIPLFGHMRDEQVELVADALTEADLAA